MSLNDSTDRPVVNDGMSPANLAVFTIRQLRDPRLSLAATGLWSKIHALTDLADGETPPSLGEIVATTTDNRAAVLAALGELRAAGYVEGWVLAQ